MLLKDPSEQQCSVQINSTLLDPGVNGFALRPSLPAVGRRRGITSISLRLDSGARRGSLLSQTTLRGKAGLCKRWWLSRLIPRGPPRGPPSNSFPEDSSGGGRWNPSSWGWPMSLISRSLLGWREPELAGLTGRSPHSCANDSNLSPSRSLAPVLRPATRAPVTQKSWHRPGWKSKAQGRSHIAHLGCAGGMGTSLQASSQPHPGTQRLRSACFVLCLSGTWSSALTPRILWYFRAGRVCDLWSDGVFTVPRCPRDPARACLKALSRNCS